MALTLEEISARMEIQDMLFRYAEIIDAKDFDNLNEVFTDDAFIDYSAMGGSKGDLPSTITFLKEAMPAMFPNSQHLNANIQLKLKGKENITEASGRVMCFNPMEQFMGDGKDNKVWFCGLWYVDEYVKVGDQWKMCQRVEEKSWFFNN